MRLMMFDDKTDGFLNSHNEVMSQEAFCHLFIPHPNASETAPPILHSAQQGQSKVAEVVAMSEIFFLEFQLIFCYRYSDRYSDISVDHKILLLLVWIGQIGRLVMCCSSTRMHTVFLWDELFRKDFSVSCVEMIFCSDSDWDYRAGCVRVWVCGGGEMPLFF